MVSHLKKITDKPVFVATSRHGNTIWESNMEIESPPACWCSSHQYGGVLIDRFSVKHPLNLESGRPHWNMLPYSFHGFIMFHLHIWFNCMVLPPGLRIWTTRTKQKKNTAPKACCHAVDLANSDQTRLEGGTNVWRCKEIEMRLQPLEETWYIVIYIYGYIIMYTVYIYIYVYVHICKNSVHGRNPAPVGRWSIPSQPHYLQCFIVTNSYQPGW